MTELVGEKALVIGASRGIGAAIAVALGEKGADVVISYLQSADRAAAVVGTIEAKGRRGVAIQADGADPSAIKRLVDEAAAAMGGLDILVNSAAAVVYEPVASISVDAIDTLVATNFRSPVLAAQAAIPHLKAGGRIIAIGSAGAERVIGQGVTVYNMTKHALHSFASSLAHELGSRDITVNVVQPGSTDTDMNPADGEWAAPQRALSPLGRFGAPEDVAAAVAFLATPAARHITGTVIRVDGGQTT